MIIEMTQDNDGVWIYHDNTQAEICLTVMALTGWEITGFDNWINTDSHWAETEFQGEEKRKKLIHLRHCLTKTFHDYNKDNYVIQLEAERLYAVAEGIASHIAGYKIARKDKDRADKAREVSKLPRPNATSMFKQAIQAAMSPYKRDCSTFKDFMRSWERNPIRGLSIKPDSYENWYVVTDEDGDLGERVYTFGTLQKMYAKI